MLSPQRAGVFARPGFLTDFGAGLVCVAIAIMIVFGVVRSLDPGAVRVCTPIEFGR